MASKAPPVKNGPDHERPPLMQSSGSPGRRRSFPYGRVGIAVSGLVAGVLLLSAGAVVAVHYAAGGQDSGGRPADIGGIVRGAAASRIDQAGTRHSRLKPAAAPGARPASAPAASSSAADPAPAQAAAPGAGSATCTNPAFVTSQPLGGWTDGSYYVANDMWNISGYSVTQTLYACSYANWYVVATMNNDSGNGAVKTYPNAHMDFSSEPAISSFRSISSTFAENSPDTGIYEDAYDIWINGVAASGSTEIMIWTQNHGQTPSGSVAGSVTLDGHAYTVWRSGSYIAFVASTNFSSGTLNLLSYFNWVIGQGWMPASSTLGQVDYGAELVSTGNAPATFSFSNFSVSTS